VQSTKSDPLIQKRMDTIKVSLSTESGDVSVDGIVFLWMVKLCAQGRWIVWNFIRLTMWHRGVLHSGSSLNHQFLHISCKRLFSPNNKEFVARKLNDTLIYFLQDITEIFQYVFM
jgi:hypothetical protein